MKRKCRSRRAEPRARTVLDLPEQRGRRRQAAPRAAGRNRFSAALGAETRLLVAASALAMQAELSPREMLLRGQRRRGSPFEAASRLNFLVALEDEKVEAPRL